MNCGIPRCLRLDTQRPQRLGKWSGLQHHALAAAERPVVHRAVPVMRKSAQIVDAHLDQSFGQRAAQDSILEDAGKEARKDSDNLKPHTL